MKKIAKMIAAAIVMVVISVNVNAQAIATATATATIVSPISIAKNVDMNFGNITVNAFAGGIVTLDPSLAATRTANAGGGVTLPAFTGTVSAAKFSVSGQANFTYDITLPLSATLSNSGNNMIADNFTSSIVSGTLDATGTEIFYVGADLNVNAGQAPGVYVTGTPFFVAVNYN
ncbi:MAG: DUF4402 domain-containing protein [Ferruginibacter sp.]